MPPIDLAAEVARFDPGLPLERAWTPPSTWYVDPAFAALDRDAVLRRGWQPVAHLADLREPGSFLSGRTLDLPWVATRDADGTLRAFHNACRHKGREVVTGAGRGERLVCGYHAWAYGLDGRLRRAPRMGGVEDFDREACALAPLRHAAWGPWLWVTLDEDAPEPAARFPEVDRALADRGWEGLRFVERVEWELACDWKVVCDNYLDGGYHIPHMHPSLDAQLDLSGYRTEVFERASIQTCPPAAGGSPAAPGGPGAPGGNGDPVPPPDPARRIGPGAIYAWLFPNLMLNRYGPCLDTNLVLPAGPGRCRIVYEFWFEPEAGAEGERFVRDSIAQSAVTQREDVEICESVQRGLTSPGYDRGRYAPSVEQGEHHFHRLLAEAYRAHLAPRATPGPAPAPTPDPAPR